MISEIFFVGGDDMDVNGNGIPDNMENVPSQFDMNKNGIDDRYEGERRRGGYASSSNNGSKNEADPNNKDELSFVTKIVLGLLAVFIVASVATSPPAMAAAVVIISAVAIGKLGHDYFKKREKSKQVNEITVVKATGKRKDEKDSKVKDKSFEIEVVKHIPLSKRREYIKENNISIVNNKFRVNEKARDVGVGMQRSFGQARGREIV